MTEQSQSKQFPRRKFGTGFRLIAAPERRYVAIAFMLLLPVGITYFQSVGARLIFIAVVTMALIALALWKREPD